MAINRFLRDKIIVQKEVQISFDLLLRERVNLNYNLSN
jgi:hypothetical protein